MGSTSERLPSMGSRRDIQKHGALVRFADSLSFRTIKAPLLYIDTRAFGIDAPIEDRLDCMRQIDSLMAEHPYYTEYVRLQKKYLDEHGRYRCPLGLVNDAIDGTPHRFFVAEPREEYHSILREQLNDRLIRCDALVDEPEKLKDISPPGGDDADFDGEDVVVLTYLDLTDAEPETIRAELEIAAHFTPTEARGVIQLNTHLEKDDLPPAASPYSKPQACLATDAEQIFAYSTDENKEDTIEICQKLGWTMFE